MTSPDSDNPDVPSADSLGMYDLGDVGRQLFQSLSLGLVVFGHDMRVIHHNGAAAFLVAGHDSVVAALEAGTVESQYEDWREVLQTVLAKGRERRFEQIVHRGADESERLLLLVCTALKDESGRNVTGGALMIEDVTVTGGLEKRLAVSERMAAVGKLAARIAHELNNPLDGILRYISLATRAVEIEKLEKVPEYLKEGRKGLLRMAEILRELVEFSRGTGSAFDDASINAIVEEAVQVMSEKAIGNRVATVCHLSDDMPTVRGTNLFQVFCNLIKNAIDAMEDGGTLSINTEMSQGEAVIRIEDTGIGLPEGVDIDQLFEPFFTTKGPGKGTGLGLPICRDIVEKLGGTITAGPRETGGTVLTVRLPGDMGPAGRSIGGSRSRPAAARSRFGSDPEENTA